MQTEFQKMAEDFPHSKMQFTKDEQGKEILLKDGKFQVMMEWEKPYMHACIDALKPFGDVLEVGFGLGYSSDKIQSYRPKSHTIIEYHPVVADRARKWAQAYPNVTIIEDTWQHALPLLGEFDCIFFDDYPLQSEKEMQQMQEESAHSQLLLKKGEQLLQDVEKTLPFLSSIKYSDVDLAAFIQQIPLEQKNDVLQFARFLTELFQRDQITETQLHTHLKALTQLNAEERAALLANPQKKEAAPSPNERLFTFLNECLAAHMRKDARFSCFLSSPESKYLDEKFVREIIANPYLDYHEAELAIEVPANCSYFSGGKALVITITKRGD
jgi:hypothetical protein